MDEAQVALARIQAEIPNPPAEIMRLDLDSLASVRQFADELRQDTIVWMCWWIGYPMTVTPNDAAHDEGDARQSWEVSVGETGVRFAQSEQAEISHTG